MRLSAFGSMNSGRSACEWMSMKPGASARPRRSISSAPAGRRGPIAEMRSPVTAMSSSRPGAPLPSKTVAPRSTRSARRALARAWASAGAGASAGGTSVPAAARAEVRTKVRRSMGLRSRGRARRWGLPSGASDATVAVARAIATAVGKAGEEWKEPSRRGVSLRPRRATRAPCPSAADRPPSGRGRRKRGGAAGSGRAPRPRAAMRRW